MFESNPNPPSKQISDLKLMVDNPDSQTISVHGILPLSHRTVSQKDEDDVLIGSHIVLASGCNLYEHSNSSFKDIIVREQQLKSQDSVSRECSSLSAETSQNHISQISRVECKRIEPEWKHLISKFRDVLKGECNLEFDPSLLENPKIISEFEAKVMACDIKTDEGKAKLSSELQLIIQRERQILQQKPVNTMNQFGGGGGGGCGGVGGLIEQTGHSPFKINSVQLLDIKKAEYQLTCNEGITVEEVAKALEVLRETAKELKFEHFHQMAETIAKNLQVVGEPFSMLKWEFKIYSGNACMKFVEISGNSVWHLNKFKANLTIAVGGAQAQYSAPIDHYQEKVKYGRRRFEFIGPKKFEWVPFQRTRALDMGHIDQLRKALEAKIPEIQGWIKNVLST